jgi:hypothetical protein
MQLYFASQLNALYILLIRMAGPRVYQVLETNLNRKAEQNGWPILIGRGHVVFGNSVQADACRALLSEVAAYAANVLGRRMVEREMRAVDEQLTAGSVAVAHELGLRR